MANDEQNNTNKVPVSAKFDADVFGAVSMLAVKEDRSLSNMIERLLKTHPRVQELLDPAQAEGAGAA